MRGKWVKSMGTSKKNDAQFGRLTSERHKGHTILWQLLAYFDQQSAHPASSPSTPRDICFAFKAHHTFVARLDGHIDETVVVL